LNFTTFSEDSLAILIIWFCPDFGWWDISYTSSPLHLFLDQYPY
jgi:hypothetical protein